MFLMKKLTETTAVSISLAILIAGGFWYVRGIEKDGLAAQGDIARHDRILENIPVIQKDIAGIRATQDEMSKRLDRIGEFLSKLPRR